MSQHGLSLIVSSVESSSLRSLINQLLLTKEGSILGGADLQPLVSSPGSYVNAHKEFSQGLAHQHDRALPFRHFLVFTHSNRSLTKRFKLS